MLRIVAVSGMPGAGMSTATKGMVRAGWSRVVMGDVIRAETERRGLEPDSKNTGEVMKLLRKEGGPTAVADLCLGQMAKSGAERAVVDGIRSMTEVEAFRKKASVLLVAVTASPSRRFELLRERGRKDDPLSYEMFAARDRRELEVGIGEAIALADESVSNQRDTPEELASVVVKLVERWEADARA